MIPIFERGDIFYLKKVSIPVAEGEKEVILDKFVIVLQSGRIFLRTKEIQVVFGTTSPKRMKNNFPTDIILESSESGLPKKTKFICSKIYLIPKDYFYGLTAYCTLSKEVMGKIDLALIRGLCIDLESIVNYLEKTKSTNGYSET